MVAWLRAIVHGAAITLLVASARAEGLSGGVGVTNDKVYRGLSQNRGGGSLMLDLSYLRGGWAVGAGAATLHDNGRGTGSELTLSLHRHWQPHEDWSMQLGGSAYGYPGSHDARYRSYLEFGAQLQWRGLWSLAVLAAPRAPASGPDRRPVRGRTVAYETAVHLPLSGRWSIDAGAGWNDQRGIQSTSHAYGSIGVSWGIGPLTLFVSRVASNADSRGGASKAFVGDRTVLTAWTSF